MDVCINGMENIDFHNRKFFIVISKRDIYIAMSILSLIVVLCCSGFFYAFASKTGTDMNMSNKSGINMSHESMNKTRRIYFSRLSDNINAANGIYSIDYNGENEIALIEKCPPTVVKFIFRSINKLFLFSLIEKCPVANSKCILRPVVIHSIGEFIIFIAQEVHETEGKVKEILKTYSIRNDGKELTFMCDKALISYSPDFTTSIFKGHSDYDYMIRKFIDNEILRSCTLVNYSADIKVTGQFSPDGKYIQVLKNGEFYNFDIEADEIVGEKLANPGINSPDGEKLLHWDQDLYFISDSNGSNKNYLKLSVKGTSTPSWSRDSTSLLTVKTNRDGTFSIQILELNPARTEISKTKFVKQSMTDIIAIW
jgi:hypothetical protein